MVYSENLPVFRLAPAGGTGLGSGLVYILARYLQY
jgi:hypothetical protein